jgi:acyl carrier protein
MASDSTTFQETTASRVKAIMVRTLDLGVTPDQIADGQSLYSSVIRLDSIGLLQLLVAFETEFACHLDDEDVMAADLDDVASLVRLVEDRLQR